MGNTKEKKLETLKKKLDEVETKNFMNKMIDRWTSENYDIDRETSKEIAELEKEIKELEKSKNEK